MSELRECPLCCGQAGAWQGSESAIEWFREKAPSWWFIGCNKCGLQISANDRERAEALWNTRPSPAPGMDIVEVVARAIAEHDGLNWLDIELYSYGPEKSQESYLGRARAALASIPPQGERERIVAWLERTFQSRHPEDRALARYIADAIRSGGHLEEPEKVI